MKISNILTRLSLILCTALVSSCVSSTESLRTPSLISTSPPNNNATPTLKSVATATPTSLLTPTTVSTLPVEDARNRLLALLANNGDCLLPCLWGITPGKSTYQEAQAILVPLSSLSELTAFTPDGGAIFPVYTEDNLMLNTVAGYNVNALSEDQIVSRIGLQMRALKKEDNESTEVFDWPFFSEQTSYYMLPSTLTEYGSPATVMLSTMAKLPSSGVPGGFKLLLLYPDQGILVNYTMQMQLVGENVMGCPSNAHMEFELFPSGQSDSFFEKLDLSGWAQIIKNTYKPIHEVTSMSQEEFFHIFSQQTDECIITPANLWPVPG